MPRKSQRPCAWTGCGQLTYNRYCDKHQKEANSQYEKNGRDHEASRHYNTGRWQRLRKLQLAREPMCRHCKERGQLVRASHADHIIEIADGGSVYDLDNLQSLCRSCHSTKTLKERARRNAKG
ncbi:MAG: HNH endonuclease [Firmicutes bacterium]|nr:HNH endonuclease [Bacillota bacterium]